MKAQIVSVAEAGFDGKDERVAGASLTFLDEGGAEKTLVGYGPAMTKVLEWKAGESHEIEVFRPEGKNVDRFRLPREQKAGGGFGGVAAYRNSREGQLYEQDQMTIRTALMQSVALAATGGIVRVRGVATAGGGVKQDASDVQILEVADAFLGWMRAKANGK